MWLLIILGESVLGSLRTWYLAPLIGDFPARRFGLITGTVFIFLVSLALIRWLGATRVRALLAIGALWVALTVVFEITLGRLVLGFSWSRLASDYDISQGGLMSFGLLAMLLTPWLTARVRNIQPAAGPLP